MHPVFSTIFNAALSLHRLLKVTRVRLSLLRHVALPLLCAAVSVMGGQLLLGSLSFSQALYQAAAQTLVSGGLFAILYAGTCRVFARRKSAGNGKAKKSRPVKGRPKKPIKIYKLSPRLWPAREIVRQPFWETPAAVPAPG